MNCSMAFCASASVAISTNANPREGARLECRLDGLNLAGLRVSGEVITAGEMNAHNEFGKPPAVRPAPFRDVAINGDRLIVEMPAKSVVMLTLEGGGAP